MDEIIFLCPATGQQIKTGIITDKNTFEHLQDAGSNIKCSHCGGTHSWHTAEAWLGDERLQLKT